MTYTTNDQSAASGRPMEFYKFEGSLRDYFYIDQSKTETLQGQLYEPLAIMRGNIDIGSVIDSQKSMTIQVPADSDLARDYGGELTPSALTVTIYRAYRGDDLLTEFKQRYKGRATTYGYEGRMFGIEFNNVIQNDLNSPNREVYYQTPCNHILYDVRCKADRPSNTVTANVIAFSDTAIEVDDDGFANDGLRVGTAIVVRTGEERLIFGNLENVIDIGYPFVDIEVGDQVQLVRGCNNGTSDCILGFNNYVNYGGFLFLPPVNPFENEF